MWKPIPSIIHLPSLLALDTETPYPPPPSPLLPAFPHQSTQQCLAVKADPHAQAPEKKNRFGLFRILN